jgi:hypothetical protein
VTRRFSRSVIAAIDDSKILGIRAGRASTHRFGWSASSVRRERSPRANR